MAGITNRGKYRTLEWAFRGVTRPTNFFVILFTSASVPTPDTNVVSDHTQVSTGNGYVDGGFSLTPNSTDFDVLTEDDTNDRALIQVKDVTWTASGGSVPASNSARYAAITTDEATVANRQVVSWFDLVADRQVSVGQQLTLQNLEMRLTE